MSTTSAGRHRPETGRAVVLGASMAGLLAARALSETFEAVVVIERDPLTSAGPRKGVPQGQHTHGILARGEDILEELLPGLTAELVAAGGTALDIHHDIVWFSGDRPLSGGHSDLTALAISRPALEDQVRARVAALSNVDIRGGVEAERLLASDGGVTGVTTVHIGDGARTEVAADLVVDATGRGNRGPTWLAQLGYPAPKEDTVKAGIAYATRLYRRDRPLPSGAAGMICGPSASFPYGAAMLPIEDDRWIVTLIGIGDVVPPVDVDGFDAYARALPMTDLHAVTDGAVPLTEPRAFRVPASVRRRYESLPRLPDGYLVVGDALCAFNPVYGQGMTVAAAEAEVLRDCLRDGQADLPRRFYAKAARFVDIPWDVAAGGDLAIPTTVGHRTMKVRLLNRYMAKLLRAAEIDPQVSLAFHRTVNLTSRPERLLAPGVVRRVLFPRPALAVSR